MKNTKSAYTLLELSIVLLIIGFMAAAIGIGQSLMLSARLSKIVFSFNNFDTATSAFYSKYRKLPGDMDDAYKFWASNCSSTGTDDINKCNGNNDAKLSSSGSEYSENTRFWQHLSLSGFLEGGFNGLEGTVAGVNVPNAPIEGSVFYAYTLDNPNVDFPITANTFELTRVVLHEPILDPVQAKILDQKYDDGLPYAGNIFGVNFTNSSDCVNYQPPLGTYLAGGAGCLLFKKMTVSNY